jgi:hypothetical protein
VVPQAWHDFVRLWAACRGEMGIAHWPDPGGVAHQAAWIVDAFSALAALAEQLRKADKPGGRN